jgi:hypothetical protein
MLFGLQHISLVNSCQPMLNIGFLFAFQSVALFSCFGYWLSWASEMSDVSVLSLYIGLCGEEGEIQSNFVKLILEYFLLILIHCTLY